MLAGAVPESLALRFGFSKPALATLPCFPYYPAATEGGGMSRRKWFVRTLVFSIVGVCACAVLLYQRFTNPAAVREQVLAKLKSHFPGALATVDSARLHLLGGIMVNELRLARRDDPDKTELLHVPSAVLYHDKEKILEGELSLRRVELHRPRLRVQRSKDGSWNLEGLSGQMQPNMPLPTLVIHQGTLIVEDRADGGTGKSVELTNVELTLINDPLATVVITGSAGTEATGKFQISGQWQRNSQQMVLALKAQQVALGALVVERLEKICPGGSLEGLKLEGRADLKADISYQPELSTPLSYDVRALVRQAKIQHPKLPLPLEQLDASLHCTNGEIRVDKLRARSGATEIEGRASTLLPSVDQFFECKVEARHVEITEALFANLPERLQLLYRAFQPVGQATFRAECARREGAWVALP